MSYDNTKAARQARTHFDVLRSPADAAHTDQRGRAMHGYQHLRQRLGDLRNRTN